MLKNFIVGVALVVMTFITNWVLIQDVHCVQKGETLDGITRTYMEKNTYGTREFHEFREGIIELNNLHGEVVPGQNLRINYWVAED